MSVPGAGQIQNVTCTSRECWVFAACGTACGYLLAGAFVAAKIAKDVFDNCKDNQSHHCHGKSTIALDISLGVIYGVPLFVGGIVAASCLLKKGITVIKNAKQEDPERTPIKGHS